MIAEDYREQVLESHFGFIDLLIDEELKYE